MPTPNIDRLADEGMTFFSFYAQPSCTPRAAMQTGRIPNRSGMTTVAFQVRAASAGGGSGPRPGAEEGRLPHLFYRQVAPGRGGLCPAQCPGLRRDEICRPVSPERLHLCRSHRFPDMDPELRQMFLNVTKGRYLARQGEAEGGFHVNGQYVNEPGKSVTCTASPTPMGSSVSVLRQPCGKGAIDFWRAAGTHALYINVNFMKVHSSRTCWPGVRAQVAVQEQVRRLHRGLDTGSAYHGQAAGTGAG